MASRTGRLTAVIFSEKLLQALLEAPILLLQAQDPLLGALLPEGQLRDLLLKGLHPDTIAKALPLGNLQIFTATRGVHPFDALAFSFGGFGRSRQEKLKC